MALVLLHSSGYHVFELFLLHLHDANSFLQILLEDHNSLLVGVHTLCVLILFNLEVESILLKHLHCRLFWKGEEHSVDLTLASSKHLELL